MHSFFHVTICPGRTLVLTQVFCPGNNEEGFQVAVGVLDVTKNSPPVCAIATTNALVLVHRLEKLCFPFRVYIIFNRDKNGTVIHSRRILVRMVGNRQCTQGVTSTAASGNFKNSPNTVVAIVPTPAQINAT